MITIKLWHKLPDGEVVCREAEVERIPHATANVGPSIVTWNDGPATRYFWRYLYSTDYHETKPVAVTVK